MDEQYNPMLPTDVPTSAPTPPPVQSPPPAVPPSKPSSSMRVVWVVLAGIAVLAGGAYGWMRLNPAAPAVESPSPSPSATTTADPTAGWKMYTNTQYGYEIKYPASWKYEASSSGVVFLSPEDLERRKIATEWYFTNLIVSKTSFTSLEDFIKDRERYCQTPVERFTLDGTPVMRSVACDLGSPVTAIWISKGNLFNFVYPSAGGRVIPDQILSTFKFTTPTSSVPADWKAFSSRYFTLSFMVPPGFDVQDTLNMITMRMKGDPSGPAIDVLRYGETYSKTKAESNFRASHSKVISSVVSIDGSNFTRLDGVSVDALRSQSLILFEKSSLLLSADATGQDRTDLSIPNQILATFKFTK